MDPYRRHILRLIEERRPPITLREASLAIGRNHAYLQQFIHRGSPRELPETVRLQLAALLGRDEKELRREAVDSSSHPGGEVNLPETNPLVRYPAPPLGARDLPVYGSAVGGADGDFYMNGQIHEYLARPEQLRAVRNAYALYISGDSMEPVAYAGQIAYVNPNKPLTTNCLVAVELQNGVGLVKQFVRRTPTKLVLRQFNPAKEIELPLGQVRATHRIVLHGDPA